MNYFEPKAAAERYAKGRPDFHAGTIKRVKAFLHLEEKLGKALDVACGTGLSTKALLEIAAEVYGTDTSQEMLHLAPQNTAIQYSFAPAEQQPFPDHSFDLLTVSSGVHWFDADRFLQEAQRLLKSKTWLVIYDNYFPGEMENQAAFHHWFSEIYLGKYPSPPRHDSYNWNNSHLHTKHFNLAEEISFKNSITFTRKQLALYFTTQSNIIAAVEKGETTFEVAEEWLNKALIPFFENENSTQILHYGNWIRFLQRTD